MTLLTATVRWGKNPKQHEVRQYSSLARLFKPLYLNGKPVMSVIFSHCTAKLCIHVQLWWEQQDKAKLGSWSVNCEGHLPKRVCILSLSFTFLTFISVIDVAFKHHSNEFSEHHKINIHMKDNKTWITRTIVTLKCDCAHHYGMFVASSLALE